MKKISTLMLLCSMAVTSNAQFGKFLKKGEGEKEEGLPKGIEIYTTEHKDAKGISGKYYIKYPVKLITANMMNMEKPFYVNEVTIEYNPDVMGGMFHFVNDEGKNKIRYSEADITKGTDFNTGPMNLNVVQKTVEKCKCTRLDIKNQFMRKAGGNQAFSDDAYIYFYTKDPDVILIGRPNLSEFKKGIKKLNGNNHQNYKGEEINVLCKDKAKLEQWDSTKIADALFEEESIFNGMVSSAFGDLVAMPKQFTNDDAREKEYFDMIKPMASEDKPEAWGDRMEYVYISQDWNVVYKDLAKKIPSHRFLHVIAVSSGWKNNECRYIPCVIKQNWEGTEYGKSYFAGFKGALVPVNCETTKKFKH